jgi:hypothetical protein
MWLCFMVDWVDHCEISVSICTEMMAKMFFVFVVFLCMINFKDLCCHVLSRKI